MARKKSGGFNKVLEFIGLVDDEDPRDIYEDEYESGNYGRQQTYTPARNTRAQAPRARQEMTTRRPGAPAYEPTRTPRMNRGASSSRFDQPARPAQGSQRRSGAFMDHGEDRNAGRYDYAPRTSSRFGSLEENGSAMGAPYAEENALQRPTRGGARQRTVMFSLHTLEDCCDVIDNLILNNTVVLTMDDLEPRLMQRAVDTLSGAVFALHATIRKASERTYLIAPSGVEVNETYDMDRRF
jgi:FtsZ-interacting cell division protein YlmF